MPARCFQGCGSICARSGPLEFARQALRVCVDALPQCRALPALSGGLGAAAAAVPSEPPNVSTGLIGVAMEEDGEDDKGKTKWLNAYVGSVKKFPKGENDPEALALGKILIRKKLIKYYLG